MLKLQKVTFAVSIISLLMFSADSAKGQEDNNDAGCRNHKVVGSYTTVRHATDVWGDGSNVNHTYLLQLNLHSDGTATQEYTGSPDVMLSGGALTPYIGSWKCREDGKLVVTMIFTTYVPTSDAANHPATVPNPPAPEDLFLFAQTRTTLLFSVTDQNTLTRIQARNRVYHPADDPTDPNGGTLRPLNTVTAIYNRVVASDADLLAP